MSDINLKKATIEDIPILLLIGKSVNNPKTYPSFTKEDEWKKELDDGVTYVIEKNGIAVGDIGYKMENKESAEIIGIAIKPEFQKQGIGKKALENILKELRNTKIIRVMTHPENLSAINFYKSFGFVINSRKENYYGDGEPRIELIKVSNYGTN